MKGKPAYVVTVSEDVYHPINWDRLGSYCNLPLNEQREYHIKVPVGKTLCLKCKEIMDGKSEK